MEKKEKIDLKAANVRSLITAGVELLVIIILSATLGTYLTNRVKRDEKLLADKKQELKSMREVISQVPNPEAEMLKLTQKQEELNEKSVSKKEITKIIKQLVSKSSGFEMEIISIRPREELLSKDKNLPVGINKAYIDMAVKSTYETIGNYLKALSELDMILTIEALRVRKADGKKGQLGVSEAKVDDVLSTLLVSTYSFSGQ